MAKKDIAQRIADALLDRGERFTLGSHTYEIRPSTLGRSLMLAEYAKAMGITDNGMAVDAVSVAADAVKRDRMAVARFVAMCVLWKPREKAICSTAERIAKEAEDDALAELLVACLFKTNADAVVLDIVNGTDIASDQRRMERAISAKDSKGSITFGGRTIYGGLIDMACERYGWTLDYVLWGISLANLRLLIADRVNAVFMTDKEMKRARLSSDRETISGDDPRNAERIRQLLNQE